MVRGTSGEPGGDPRAEMMAAQIDHYSVLGVDRAATPEEIRAAYRRAARESHPDLHPDDLGALDRFKAVQRAYDVLGDPARRTAHDAQLAAQAPPVPDVHSAAAPADPPVSLARELGYTVRAIRASRFARRFGRFLRRLERL
ncbi:MAG: J domain-containing protein [Chloroflexi bacterium]|nr:J domain-containing protein [Chloroflexota bacterium]